jgi:N-dimethylarginine dimethylaminohydrolase
VLDWGRHLLVCPPTHFDVLYEINPWMRADVRVDRERALDQWTTLVSTLRSAGATVEVLEPVPGLPDLVFTANAGIVDGRRFLPSRFRNEERRGEEAVFSSWFASAGWSVAPLPGVLTHEGAGDALPFAGRLVCGHRWRTEAAAHVAVADLTGADVHLVELADPRLYHLDMTFCPLDDRRAMVTPDAYASPLGSLVPEPLVLTLDEALQLTANSVVIGSTIVMTACPVRVGRQLERWGFDVAVVDVSEFVKAGGGVRCLTLALDVTIASATEATARTA